MKQSAFFLCHFICLSLGSEFSEDKFVAKVKMEIVVSKDQVSNQFLSKYIYDSSMCVLYISQGSLCFFYGIQGSPVLCSNYHSHSSYAHRLKQ